MIKFNTLAELRSERSRLYNKKELLEEEMKLDFEELKESLKPLNMIRNMFKTDQYEHNGEPVSPAVSNLGSTIFDLIFSGLVFNKSSYVKRMISSYLIHATGPSLIQKFAPSVINKFKIWLGTMLNKRQGAQQPVFEQSTSNGWYEE